MLIQFQAVYVGAEIVILPLHNKLSLLIVLIFVPLTNVSCLEASQLVKAVVVA